jgi:hypothetical protein
MARRAGILVVLALLAGCVPAPQQPGAEIIDLTMAGRPTGTPGQGVRRSPALAAGPVAPGAAQREPAADTAPVAGNASTVAALASVAPSDPIRDYTAAHPAGGKGAVPAHPDGGLVQAAAVEPVGGAAPAPADDLVVVKSRRIQLNYEVEGVGPSGLASVAVWYTCDGGPWRKYPTAPQQSPFVVEVEREGRYGFLVLARTRAGQGKGRPDDDDKPQILVEVDVTQPALRLGVPQYDAQAHALVLLWEASDRNLGPHPIALLWAREPGGPWLPIITQRANTGRHAWKLPAGLPRRIWVRAEATDLAGNVATAGVPDPVLLPADAVPAATAARPAPVPADAGPPVPRVSAVQVIPPPAPAAAEPPSPGRAVLGLEPAKE